MWTLVRKDLIFNRRMLGWNFLFYLLFLPGFAIYDDSIPLPLYAGFAAVICAMMPLTLVAREDKFRASAFTCSLPVTREAIVGARYLGGGLLALLGAGLIIAVGYLVPQTGFATRGAGLAVPLLVAFVVIGLVQAALLPFTIRFGLTGLMVFLVVTQFLGMLAMVLAVFAGVAIVRATVGWIGPTLRALQMAFGDVAVAVLLVVAVALLNVASYRLSCWLFRSRDL
jgi:hypothetical protein